ncbi:MAG TPA: hypothetical protein VEK11_09305 [Thermoanaerobaculia bacterium]|nr:hypothetical protein [Thermoanaerobaculia bacterium]
MSQSDDVFNFGERTIFQLRAQSFTVEEEFGTMAAVPVTTPQLVEELPIAGVDPIIQLQQKLDLALRQIAALQQRVDSMDATLARALNR